MIAELLIFVATLLIITWWKSGTKNLPPSPGLELPVIGHLYLFKQDMMESIHGWRQKLGDIYRMQLGSDRCVMINGYSLISEVSLKHHDCMLHRPANFLHKEINDFLGVTSQGGDNWKEQRTFLQSTLRKLGVGRNVMAERVRFEVEHLIEDLQVTKGKPRDLSYLLMTAVMNVVCGVTCSKRFQYNSETVKSWLYFVKRIFNLLGSSAALNFFPFLKYIPGDYFHYKEMLAVVSEMKETLRKWIDKENRHINISDEDYEDITQAFLTEIERKKLKGANGTIDEPNFMATAFALFNAGTETTANTILFAVLYMIHHSELQERLYQEIQSVVGSERLPDMSDKPKLKLLNAFIAETQRYACIVPLSVERLTTKDFELGGYTVPAGTTVMMNLESSLSEKAVWGDPENFRPERFLNDEGNYVARKELIPFGIGKRNCVGESLASMENYLFIASLVQKFEFRAEDEHNLPTLTPNVGFTKSAKPFNVCARYRIQ